MLQDQSLSSSIASGDCIFDDQLGKIRNTIRVNLGTPLPFVPEIVDHLLANQYDPLRSRMMVRCAGLFSHPDDRLFDIASTLEFLHVSSLLHRRVRNPQEARRHLQQIRMIWGNEASVLLGDYLLSISFEILTKTGNLEILETVSDATRNIARGQMQEISIPFLEANPRHWWKVTENKVVSLFGAGGRSVAIWAGERNTEKNHLYNFGRHFGLASQLQADLEASSDSHKLTKCINDEKILYPLSYLLHEKLSESEAKMLRTRLLSSNGDQGLIEEVQNRLENETALHTRRQIEQQLEMACRQLKKMSGKDISPLLDLLSFSRS